MDDESESDIAESVAISAAIAAVATGLIFFELWGGSVPAASTATFALGTGLGVVAGGAFYYTGTHETLLDRLPPFAVLFVLMLIVFVLFPNGLPMAAQVAIVVGVWTDTVLRALAKYA